MLKILSICATVSLLFVSSAMARPSVGACRADIKKVCGHIKPGGSRIATCLNEHVTDLSDVCKAKLADVAAARKTCNGEIEKQCGTKGRIQKMVCIKKAFSNLGADCKAAVVAAVTSKK